MVVRPLSRDDRSGLAHAFAGMGLESRYRRFFSAKSTLSERDLEYFTEIDHHDHEAVVATLGQNGEGIGVARYIRDPEDATAAHVAVTVVDAWQHRGVGSELMQALVARAREEGVVRLVADVLATNAPMLNLLERTAPQRRLVERHGAELRFEVDI